MDIIGDVLIPSEFKKQNLYFCCDIKKCKGACCVAGDAGAPLDPEEIGEILDALDLVRPYMQKNAAEMVTENNFFDYDPEGNLVTALLNDRECVFTNFSKGIAFCAIEKAFLEKKIKFRKPVSCFLYPIRVTSNGTLRKIVFHRWEICQSGIEFGNNRKIKLVDFLSVPLREKFGKEWMSLFYNFLKNK
jgi:hypothetical protein